MTHRSLALPLLVLLLGACRPLERHGRELALVVGQRHLGEDRDFPDVDHQPMLGAELVLPLEDLPFRVETGVRYSEEDDRVGPGRLEARVLEGFVGVRRGLLSTPRIRPHVSVGVAVLWTELELSGPAADDEDELDGGVYAGLGVDWIVGRSTSIGLDARYLWDALDDGGDLDVDQLQLALRVGWGF